MGGYICQITARDHPGRVLSITALDSSPIQPLYYSALDTWLLAATPVILRLYRYENLVRTIATRIALNEDAQIYAMETLQKMTMDEIDEIMGAVYKGLFDFGDDSILPQPLLIVCGEQDRTGKVISYSKRWAKKEKRELVWIPDAAHNANQDQPEEFNRILEKFLAGLRS